MTRIVLFAAFAALICFASPCVAQSTLQYDDGFLTNDDGGLAYLQNAGNLAIIDQQGGGGGGGATRIDIYTTTGTFLQTVQLSTAGLQDGESFDDQGLADLPNGNLIVITDFGNVFEVSLATGAIVSGGYGGFNVLAEMSAGAEVSGFAHNPTTDNLWAIDDNSVPFDTIIEFSPTGAVVSGPFVALPSPANPNGNAEGLSFSPDLQSIFVAEDDTNTLVEITPTGQFLQIVDLADLTQGSGLFLDPDDVATDYAGNRVFVMNKGDNNGNVMVFSVEATETTIVPDLFNIVRGIQVAGTLADLAVSDDSYLKFNPGITLSSVEPPVWIEFQGTLPSNTPSTLTMTFEASANTVGIGQTIEMFNFNSGLYEEVHFQQATTTDSVVEIVLQGDVSRFASGTGLVRARVGWKANGPILLYPWTVCVDYVSWTM